MAIDVMGTKEQALPAVQRQAPANARMRASQRRELMSGLYDGAVALLVLLSGSVATYLLIGMGQP